MNFGTHLGKLLDDLKRALEKDKCGIVLDSLSILSRAGRVPTPAPPREHLRLALVLRKRWYLALLVVFAISAHSAFREYEAHEILQELTAHQPDGFGPPVILDTAEGVVRGEVVVTAVLFTYQIGPARDRNHWSYLMVFGYGDPIGPALVGGGSQRFSSVAITNRTILLSGRRYAPEDAMCCPSLDASIQYLIAEGQLMARASLTSP